MSLVFFQGKNFFGDDGFQNMFVYQPIFNMLKLKPDKFNDYVTDWKSNGVHNSELVKLHEVCLPYIKYFWYKIGIQFNNTSLVIEENNYKTKIVSAYIVYESKIVCLV